jgi:hypothetical protein
MPLQPKGEDSVSPMMPDRSLKTRLKRLDRIAGEINAWLVVLAAGLVVLDMVVLLTLQAPSPPSVAESGPPLDATSTGMTSHIGE